MVHRGAAADPSLLNDAEGRVVAAAIDYQQQWETGNRPSREDYLAKHAEIGDQLAPCLDAIDFFFSVLSPVNSDEKRRTPERLGDFRILRRLGAGGMGIVFEAEQTSLQRRVALKVLPSVAALDIRALQRFQHESQAAAVLKHPNIVPVFAVGQQEGVHYFVMQLIDGISLSALLQVMRTSRSAGNVSSGTTLSFEKDITPCEHLEVVLRREMSAPVTFPISSEFGTSDYFRTIARLTRDAALALQHAHEVGVIHRDVKPANLLLDKEGKIWITDFGLAKLPGSDLTGSADIMGTLRYMAPEQASGKTVSLDARSDVYSLGATLYELVTLRRAFDAGSQEALLHQVLTDEPIAPRTLLQRIPVDLETITLKALAKEPSERYPSASEFAQDLQRFLKDEPIVAQPPSLGRRAAKWMRRNRELTASIAISLPLLLLAGVVGLSIGTYQLDEQRRAAEKALERESKALSEANIANTQAAQRLKAEQAARSSERQMGYFHAVSLAHAEAENGNLEAAKNLLGNCPTSLRGFEWNYVQQLCQPELCTIPIDVDYLHEIAFTPSGELATISFEGTQLWTARSGRLAKQLPRLALEGLNGSMKMTPDGKYVLRYLDHKFVNPPLPLTQVFVFEAASGKPSGSFAGHRDALLDLVCNPDSKSIVTLDYEGRLAIWDLERMQASVFLTVKGARAIAFSPKGDCIALVSKKGIEIRDAVTGSIIRRIDDSGQDTRASARIVFSADGRFVATKNLGGKARIIEIESGETLAVVEAEMGDDGVFVFSPDGRSLATTDHRDYSIRIWNWRTGKLERRFFVSRERVRRLLYSPDGGFLATLIGKSSVQFWSVMSDTTRKSFGGLGRMVTTSGNTQAPHGRVLFSPTGNKVVAFAGTNASVFRFPQGELERVFNSNSHILDMQFDAKQPVLRQLTVDGARTLDLEHGKVQESPSATAQKYVDAKGKFADDRDVTSTSVTICPQIARYCGNRLLKPGSSKKGEPAWIESFDLHESKQPLQYRASREGHVYCIAGTSDGRRLAAATRVDNALRAWNDDFSQEAWKEESRVRVLALEYSDDGKLLGVADANGSLRILDAETGRLVSKIALPVQERVQFDFDSKGERIAIAVGRLFEGAGEVRICEVAKGQSLVKIPFDLSIESVQFSPDDRYLLASDYSSKVWMFRQDALTSEERLAAHEGATTNWRVSRIAQAQLERDHSAAIFHINHLLSREPNSSKLRVQHAISSSALGLPVNLDEITAQHLANSLQLKSISAAYCLSAYYYEHSNQAAHQQLFERLVKKLEPDADRINFSLVYRLGVMGPGGTKNLDSFIAQCEERFPTRDKDWQFTLCYLRGMARYRAGQFEAALDDLQKTAKEDATLSPSFPVVHIYLAMTLAQLNQRDEALKSLATAIDLFERGGKARRKTNAYCVDYHFPLLKQEAEKLLEEKFR